MASNNVRLASGPRGFLSREGVGAAGHIIQRSDTTSRRVVVDSATLILVEEGRKVIRYRGGKAVAKAGEALSLQAGETVDISNTPGESGSYRALWICWSPELLTPSASAHTHTRVALHSQLTEPFRSAYHGAFDALGDTAFPTSVAAHRLREVLLWLAERGFAFATPRPGSFTDSLRRDIASEPNAAWSLERVAQARAVSIATLRRRLASEGTTFRALLQDVRMSQALALLQNTDTSVLEIASASGYDSPSRFAARFRERFGFLPTDIRGQKRGRITRSS